LIPFLAEGICAPLVHLFDVQFAFFGLKEEIFCPPSTRKKGAKIFLLIADFSFTCFA